MNSSILVDTNILIYAIDADSKFHNSFIKFLSATEISFFTTIKNISEFLVVLTRKAGIDIPVTTCLQILDSLLSNIDILYPDPMTLKTFYDLINKYKPRGLWIHDIEIVSIAISHGISKIVTNNIDDFKRIEEIEIVRI